MQAKFSTGLVGALLLTQLAACRSDHVADAVPVRAVKLETVRQASRGTASFVAIVRQEQRAELSFEQPGRIASVRVDVGDPVRQGQLLATIDDEPLRLQSGRAMAREHAARIQVQERRGQLAQQQAMFDDGAISLVTLTAAKAAMASAEAELQATVSERAIAARAVRQAFLRAPFAGTVVARSLHAGMVAEPGQPVLRLDGTGRAQAVADLPPAVAARLVAGLTVQARRGDSTLQLATRSVATHIDTGGTVQAVFELPDNPAGIRTGEALAVSLDTEVGGAVLAPIPAILPEVKGKRGHVFVFHARTSMVERRKVELGEQQGQYRAIERGLAPGERVVTSGATFLSHMQKVVPYQPETKLPREAQ